MQALKEAPAYMESKDKFLFQCKVVEPGTTDSEVTSVMVFTFFVINGIYTMILIFAKSSDIF